MIRIGYRYGDYFEVSVLHSLAHTRTDLAYVCVISQFMHDPKMRHVQAVDKILHYLKATLGRGLLFKRGEMLSMEIYIDVDYAGFIIYRRSTLGYYTLGRNFGDLEV